MDWINTTFRDRSVMFFFVKLLLFAQVSDEDFIWSESSYISERHAVLRRRYIDTSIIILSVFLEKGPFFQKHFLKKWWNDRGDTFFSFNNIAKVATKAFKRMIYRADTLFHFFFQKKAQIAIWRKKNCANTLFRPSACGGTSFLPGNTPSIIDWFGLSIQVRLFCFLFTQGNWDKP